MGGNLNHSGTGLVQHAPAADIPSVSRPASGSLKATLKQYIRAFGDAPGIAPIVHHAGVKRVLSALPGTRALYGTNWDRRHPFDRQHGTDTSGFIPMENLLTGDPADAHGSPYAGAQPSITRRVLATLPDPETCTFIDLGCGKGRPLLVASEFPYRDIVGVELSPPLADVARHNAAVIAGRFPQRTPVRVVTGDATTYPLPSGNVVMFLYNSFDDALMLKLISNIEAALKAEERSIYVVYCNPACGRCFDGSPALKRRFARMIPYAPEELGFGEDTEDAVVVWQGGNAPVPTEPADAEIVIVKDRWRAELRR